MMIVFPNKKGLTLFEKVYPVRKSSPAGLTLIEIIVSLLITLVLFLALMQSALLSINTNVTNDLRNEAVSVAEMKMRELKNLSFTHTRLDAGTTVDPVEKRQIRNINNDCSIDPTKPGCFTPTITVTFIPAGIPDIKQIEVKVAWTDPSGETIEHIISSMKKK